MSVQEVNNEYVILTENLCKDYTYYKKEAGLKGSLKNLFHREKLIKKAVQNLSIKIPKGAIVGLIGLNGAGKTTTLKMLTGIIMPTSGKVDVLAYFPFDKKKEYLRRIAMVMGNKSQLWWDLPALDTFELNKIIYEIDDSEYKNTLNSMVEIMGVEKQLNVQVRRLSLGERMKMELIASLIHKPDIVFLDEPTSGLDPTTSKKIHKLLQELKERGTTIFLTTHDMNEATLLCDNLALLNKGDLIEQGSPNEIIQKYNTEKNVAVTYSDSTKKVVRFEDLQQEDYKKIMTIHSGEPTLEDIFIKLTGEKLDV